MAPIWIPETSGIQIPTVGIFEYFLQEKTIECLIPRLPKCFRDAKVSQLEQFVSRDENVLGLDVPVEDVLLVQVLEGKTDLDKPVPNLRLKRKRNWLF